MPLSRWMLSMLGLLFAAAPALAQQADEISTTTPATPVAAWLSVAVGPGKLHDRPNLAIAGAVRANISFGNLLVSYRGDVAGPMFSGVGVTDYGLLAGLRTAGKRAFLSGSLGLASATPYYQCEGCAKRSTDGSSTVVAWDVVLHANYIVPGVAFALSGAMGPANVRYSTATAGLELGWFGR